jgi:hypothetical protein
MVGSHAKCFAHVLTEGMQLPAASQALSVCCALAQVVGAQTFDVPG